jgi:superfamily II DNA or RNA helicase
MMNPRELRKALTVRALEKCAGLRPPSFKVYRDTPNGLLVPRFFEGSPKAECSKGHSAPELNFVGSLRPHQKEALGAFKGNGVLCLPCGQGKTATGLALASKYKRKTLVIVHKEILADQWTERINQFCPGIKVGRIQGDRWETEGAPIVLAMIQTLCIREFPKGSFDQFGFVIVDEAHHIGAPAFSQVMLGMKPEYTLGLTATPERKDGLTKILYWFLGPMFYKMDAQVEGELIVNRIDFDCPQFRSEAPTLNRLGKLCMPSNITRLTEIKERNDLIVKNIKDAQKRNRKILVLSDRRSHCEYIFQALEGAVLSMGGSVDPPALTNGASTLISTFGLAREGLDIPELDTLFIVTPISDVVQALGRITRGPGTKEVHDVVDNWANFKNMWYRRNSTYKGPGPAPECLFTGSGLFSPSPSPKAPTQEPLQ